MDENQGDKVERSETAAQGGNLKDVPTEDGTDGSIKRKPKPTMKALIAKVNDLETQRS